MKRKIFLAILFLPLAAYADCIDALKERSMAVKVLDYSAMLRIANKVELECKRDMNSREMADYKADKAIANYFLGNTRATLKEAKLCIEIHYAKPVCHYWVAVANADLKNKKEFEKAKSTGLSIANAIINNERNDMTSARTELEKLNVSAEAEAAKAALKNLETLEYR